MFYSAKNAKLKINDEQFVCADLQLNYESQINPVYYEGKGYNVNYAPTNGVLGNLRFTYYLTGSDPLKSFLSSTGKISANICGITVDSGYLRNFSFNGVPNSPVQPTAEIVFFDSPAGTFAPESVVKESIQSFNFSDITLTQLTDYSNEDLSNLISVNYSYTSEIEPIFTINSGVGLNNIIPERIVFGQRQIVTQLICDNLNTPLPITGKNLGLSITLKHPNQNLTENYKCSGVLSTKNIAASVGDSIKTLYTIVQNKVVPEPYISSVDPLIVAWGNVITIDGSNFDNLLSVFVGEDECVVTSYTSTQIITTVPFNSVSNPVTVKTLNGTTISSSSLNIAQPATRVDSLFPTVRFSSPPQANTAGQELILRVTGDNFYRISQVRVGDTIAPFEIVSPTVLIARLPEYTNNGPLVVWSSGRDISGVSLTGITFPPYISGILPVTGITGDTISIYGSNLGLAQKVRFGTVNATSFNVVNTGLITAVVPSGLTRAHVYVSGSGYSGFSPVPFEPQLIVSRVFPISGKQNTPVSIHGNNFIPELMFATGSEYLVTFNGIYSAVKRNSDTWLSGIVPTGYTVGPVFVLNESGLFTKSASGFFSGIINPVISGAFPQFIYSGSFSQFGIVGQYLNSVSSILLSGVSSNNINNTITFNSNLSGHADGTRVIVTGYRFTNILTGKYQTLCINYAGTGYLTGISGSLISGITILPAINLALRGVSTQSGRYTGDGSGLYYAYFGQDTITSGTQANRFLAWTASGDNPFWQVDLRAQYEIKEIKVFNRFDTGLNLSSSLTEFGVTIYTGANGLGQVFQTNHTSAPVLQQRFLVPNLTGRFVKLVLSGTNKSLALAEVEVY